MNTTAQVLKFLFAALAAAYSKAAAALIDWANPPEPEWLWVGKGDLLFTRTLEESAFVFTGDLKIDRETCARHFGSFGSDFEPGCLEFDAGRFFYPTVSYDSRVDALKKDGFSTYQAVLRAQTSLFADLEMALREERESKFLTLTVSAVRRNAKNEIESVLATTSISGLLGNPNPLKMDPFIDEMFRSLVSQAEREAIVQMRSIRNDRRSDVK